VMLALASLSRLGLRAGETVNVQPFDIDPSEGRSLNSEEAR